jgi:hypothetical protein
MTLEEFYETIEHEQIVEISHISILGDPATLEIFFKQGTPYKPLTITNAYIKSRRKKDIINQVLYLNYFRCLQPDTDMKDIDVGPTFMSYFGIDKIWLFRVSFKDGNGNTHTKLFERTDKSECEHERGVIKKLLK